MTPHAQDMEKWIDVLSEVSPKTYLDVGAGDGFDCMEVKKAFPDCRCIAIEPHEAWEVGDEIGKLRDVVGAANEQVFYHIKAMPGIHGVYNRAVVDTLAVVVKKAKTLDSICDREVILGVDAMKIDVEGAAWDVLVGGSRTLSSVKAIHIETEWLPLFDGQTLEPEVFAILERNGLTRVWENRVESLGQGDSIWVRK